MVGVRRRPCLHSPERLSAGRGGSRRAAALTLLPTGIPGDEGEVTEKRGGRSDSASVTASSDGPRAGDGRRRRGVRSSTAPADHYGEFVTVPEAPARLPCVFANRSGVGRRYEGAGAASGAAGFIASSAGAIADADLPARRARRPKAAGQEERKGKRTQSPGNQSRTSRKPMLSLRSSGVPLTRSAERTHLVPVFQEPPRRTRWSPLPAAAQRCSAPP